MAVVTAQQVVDWTNTSGTEAKIAASGLIPIVQDRIGVLTNNYFTNGLMLQGPVTFNATARTVVSANNYASRGVYAGAEVMVYGSYRNDDYYTVLSVSTVTITLATGSTVVDELSGASVLVSVVQWPRDVQHAAAQMVKFDYEDRAGRNSGAVSRSLGPYSESFAEGGMDFGYPDGILSILRPYKLVSSA